MFSTELVFRLIQTTALKNKCIRNGINRQSWTQIPQTRGKQSICSWTLWLGSPLNVCVFGVRLHVDLGCFLPCLHGYCAKGVRRQEAGKRELGFRMFAFNWTLKNFAAMPAASGEWVGGQGRPLFSSHLNLGEQLRYWRPPRSPLCC